MKNLKASPKILGILAVALCSTQMLHAATPIWNNAAGGNWSVPGNWSPVAIPGAADDVQFGDTGTGSQNTMDTAFTINSLTYNQDNQATHTTLLNPGLTLTITRTTTGDPLTVGSTSGATTSGTLLPVTVQGPGATLSLSGTGDLVVRQGNGTAGSHMATLDLSAVDTLNATIGRLLVGQANAGAAVNRPSGTLFLAKTNTFTFSGTAPQVMVQDSGSNANGGTVSLLNLGQVTFFYGDQFRFGGQKGNGNVQFNNAFQNPLFVIRNTDQASRATQIAFGDNSFAASGNSTVANDDFTGGIVDMLATTVYVARGNPGGSGFTGQSTATVAYSAGTFDINTLEIGFQVATTLNGAATGTLQVNNNNIVTTNANSGLISTGAVLVVNTSIRLAHTNGSTGAVAGTLAVNGGTVLANSIVTGGGNSTITLAAGSLLVVSNNVGTLAAPIRNFNISDAALALPAQNSGGVVAVSNLVAGGTLNTINISAVPPIGSYPATFTLVSYKTGSTGNFALGTLPPASPSYAGSLVDLGNGVIQLKLTAGPVVDLSLLWKATFDNNWDTTTGNWTSHGNPTNFFAGATPIFDDTAAQTTVNLVPALSSGTVTVNNSTKAYDFTGPGNIAGASSLVKSGTQTLTIENQGIDSFGSVTVSGGTLQIGTGDVNGEISSLNITNNAALVVNRSGPMDLSAAIGGAGSLMKLGNGTLKLSGASSYTGPTTLTAGGLEIDGSLGGNGALTTAASTVLSGVGSVGGPVTVAGAFNPGSINGTGTFTGSNAMTFSSGSTLTFDLNGANPSLSDTVALTGNLTLNNNAVTANFLGVPQVGSTYTLFTYGGALAGSFNPTVTGTHFTTALDTSSLGVVNLTVTGGSGANLKWTGATDGTTWDSTVINWADAITAASSQFFSGDNVLLDDSTGNAGLTIAAGVSVYPAAITNNSDSTSYSISGAGKISGSASIVKQGASTLTIATANDFTGTVDIQAGTVKVGSGTALGSGATGTLVESNATLDVNGQSIGGETITASGMGVGGGGAIINTGGTQITALRSVILAGDTAFGGTGMWAINNSGGAGSLSTGSQPYKLFKVGANQVALENLTTVDAALADIEVQQGILEFNGLTASMGDATHTNIVDAGATEQFTSDSVVWQKHFNLNGNGTANTINNGTSATTEFAGPTELHGGVVFNVGGTSLTISGDISGGGGIIKNGTSPMILTGNNTFTGDTIINAGALRVGGTATLISSNIVIATGGALTATGRVDATFTLAANQTLSGNGVINGALATLAGSTLSPGSNSIVGGLTVSNAVALGGTNSFDLDQNNKTNDVLNVGGALTYGGTLNLTTLTGALTNGATFKLFKALSISGSFAGITPSTPGTGLTWNTAALSSGIIGVTNNGTVINPTTNASITSVKVVGGNLVIHGTNNNVPNTNFKWVVLTSTNLTLPLSSWTPVVTNSFTGTGEFDFTTPIVTTTPKLFFDVKVQ